MATTARRPAARRGASLATGLLVLLIVLGALAGAGALVWRSARAARPVAAQVAAPTSAAPAVAAPSGASEAELRALLGDPARLVQAQSIFLAKCAMCHTPTGEGIPMLGPNLTDDYWLHGSDMTDLVNTITNGVPGKAMIAWKGQLSDDEIKSMAVYVVSLKGTGSGHGKPAEGELKPIAYWPKP